MNEFLYDLQQSRDNKHQRIDKKEKTNLENYINFHYLEIIKYDENV